MTKEFEAVDCMYTRSYAEDDALLNEFVDRIIRNVSWHMFEHQDEVCYNISVCNPPKLKDNVIEYMRKVINSELSWLRHYIIMRMLIGYRVGNVDLGEEGQLYLEDEFGDEYPEIEKQLREYVYKDYLKYLGKEKTDAYFRKIGREDWILNE